MPSAFKEPPFTPIQPATSVQDFQQHHLWNFREVCPLATQGGRIFRASSLTRYQSDPYFAEWIQQCGITHVIDLRDTDEYAANPYTADSLRLFTHLHLPIDPRQQDETFRLHHHQGSDNEIAYRHYAYGHPHIFREIFTRISPLTDRFMVHCHAGKDRTGVVIAMMMLLCGASPEQVQHEYLASQMDTSLLYLNAFLSFVADQGGVDAYLRVFCDVPDSALQQWKSAYSFFPHR